MSKPGAKGDGEGISDESGIEVISESVTTDSGLAGLSELFSGELALGIMSIPDVS